MAHGHVVVFVGVSPPLQVVVVEPGLITDYGIGVGLFCLCPMVEGFLDRGRQVWGIVGRVLGCYPVSIRPTY